MTKTLGKVSEVARTDFNLLDDREQETALSDLEHLLVTEFSETELPAPTRVTFAATKIAMLAAGREQPAQDSRNWSASGFTSAVARAKLRSD